MYLCSVGVATPENSISNNFLEELGIKASRLSSSLGIEKRFSCLPEAYLQETRNEDPRKAQAHASITPSELGEMAARRALLKAGVEAQELSLLLAGTATPLETCPSEAQRIGSLLGVKIPAFDIVAGSLDIPTQLKFLKSWKGEKKKGYALCVSTNLMTQRIHYHQNQCEAASLFGDAACAVLISFESGTFKIDDVLLETAGNNSYALELDIFAPLQFSEEVFLAEIEKDASSKEFLNAENIIDAGFLALSQAGNETVQKTPLRNAFCMGSSFGDLLDQSLEGLAADESRTLYFPGLGAGRAFLSLQRGEA